MKTEIKEALDNWAKKGWRPGGFLTAVLENDLREAMGRADIQNRVDLFEIVSYCYNKLPAACWGSPEAMATWEEIIAEANSSV